MNRFDGETEAAVCDCKLRIIGERLTAGGAVIVNMAKVETVIVISNAVTSTALVTRDLRIRSGSNLLVIPAKGGATAIRKRLMFAAAAF